MFREYERCVVTAFDAYTKPILAGYLARLTELLEGLGVPAPLQIMQSRGGLSATKTVAKRRGASVSQRTGRRGYRWLLCGRGGRC